MAVDPLSVLFGALSVDQVDSNREKAIWCSQLHLEVFQHWMQHYLTPETTVKYIPMTKRQEFVNALQFLMQVAPQFFKENFSLLGELKKAYTPRATWKQLLSVFQQQLIPQLEALCCYKQPPPPLSEFWCGDEQLRTFYNLWWKEFNPCFKDALAQAKAVSWYPQECNCIIQVRGQPSASEFAQLLQKEWNTWSKETDVTSKQLLRVISYGVAELRTYRDDCLHSGSSFSPSVIQSLESDVQGALQPLQQNLGLIGWFFHYKAPKHEPEEEEEEEVKKNKRNKEDEEEKLEEKEEKEEEVQKE